MGTAGRGQATGALRVEERTIAGHAQDVRLRLYRPTAARRLPGVLYLHGGGFTSGSPEEAEVTASHLARAIPALVVSVGYSLAPAHPFPTALLDAHRAAHWLEQSAGGLGVRTGGLGLAGHDAGGHVAVSLTFLARDQGGPKLDAVALLGPMLDPSLTRADDAAAPGSDQSVAACARCYRAYLPDAALRLHPYASPLESSRLGRLPPTLIITAEKDVLRAEAESFAARLIAAGVPTETTRFSSVTHAALPAHGPALDAASDFLRRRLAGARS